MDKERKSTAWHNNSQTTISAPLIIDPTVGRLTEKMKTACRKFGEAMDMNVVVKVRAGRSVKTDAKSEPLRKPECGRENCLCCASGNPGGCEKNGIGYRIICEGCQEAGIVAEYEGESGRNAFARGLEHQADLRNESEKSALWKHCQLQHAGEKQSFMMMVFRGFNSCLERQTNEAVRITSSKAEVILNSKSEFHQAPIRRVVATAGLHALQAVEQGRVAVRSRGSARGTRATRAGRGRGRGRPRGD